VFTVALCGVPAVAVIEAGGPGRLVSTKPGLVVRVFALAVTEYFPETVLALKICEVAIPLALVIAVFPQEKVPLAPLVGGLNVTSTPETGFEELSSTVATRGFAKFLVTVALCGVPPVALMVAGTCGSVTVKVTGTIICIELLEYWKKTTSPA
jgi:hypothetical protein